jgi:hypothetical protein
LKVVQSEKLVDFSTSIQQYSVHFLVKVFKGTGS